MLAVHRALGTWRRHVDAYIALTEFARREFIAGGLPGDRIHVRPNFLRDPGLEHLVETSGKEYAVFVGRLSEIKGARILVEAWKGVPVPLVVLGDGPLGEELRRIAPSQVEFRGHVAHGQVLEAMRRAAFAVVPSITFEGFPLAVVDAFASGIPVLASRLGSLAEIVEDGVTGRLFAPGDAEDLARTAREIASAPAERVRLGRAARAVYEDRYTSEAAIESLERVYRSAIESRRGRPTGDPK